MEVPEQDAVEDDDNAKAEAEDDAVIRQLAIDQYGSGDINIDDDAVVSVGNDGAYVAAWVFVDKSRIPGWDGEEEEDEEEDD